VRTHASKTSVQANGASQQQDKIALDDFDISVARQPAKVRQYQLFCV
jgi:hypothetical protein